MGRLLTLPLASSDEALLRAHPRPKTRGDCIDGPRPCPWVGCRHHLYLDVLPGSGELKIRLGGEPEDLPEDRSCALDVADRGGATLDDLAQLAGLTRERMRQIEAKAIARLRRASSFSSTSAGTLREFCDVVDFETATSLGASEGGLAASSIQSGRADEGDHEEAQADADAPLRVSFAEDSVAAERVVLAMVWRAYLRKSVEDGFEIDRKARGTLSPELAAVTALTTAELDDRDRGRRARAFSERPPPAPSRNTRDTRDMRDMRDRSGTNDTRHDKEAMMTAKTRTKGALLEVVQIAYGDELDRLGRPPTAREIFEHLGKTQGRSVNNVYGAIRRLEQKGVLPSRPSRPQPQAESITSQSEVGDMDEAAASRPKGRGKRIAPPRTDRSADMPAASAESAATAMRSLFTPSETTRSLVPATSTQLALATDARSALVEALTALRDDHRRRADAIEAALTAITT